MTSLLVSLLFLLLFVSCGRGLGWGDRRVRARQTDKQTDK